MSEIEKIEINTLKVKIMGLEKLINSLKHELMLAREGFVEISKEEKRRNLNRFVRKIS